MIWKRKTKKNDKLDDVRAQALDNKAYPKESHAEFQFSVGSQRQCLQAVLNHGI